MEAGTLTPGGSYVYCAPLELPRRMEAVGAFHASGDISLRPGTFDAVGDRIPVPGRARRPPAGRNAPGRAQCPRPQAAGAPTDYSGIPEFKRISNGTTAVAPMTRIDNSTTSTKISDPFSVRDMPWCFPMLSAPGSPFRIEAR